ncbi:DUF4232 domain-containing protein [Kitasatospora sp. NPDC051914]|uniref:DUF4232 domain-containing protein n=1 Tax=Kitasatospora sp. NPDC051914 TaxID=3154945 RepID=UPI003446A794
MKQRPTTAARAAAATAAVLALALGAVACNDDTTAAGSGAAPTAAGTTASSPAADGGAATAGTAGPGSAATGKGTAPAQNASERCRTGELKADVQIQEGGGRAMVMLVNKGSRTCTVKGYLGYGGLLADNSRVDTATHRVAQPGPPVSVTLKPGTTAFSGLSWKSCDKADTTCTVLAGLVVTPPDETTQLTAAVLGTDGKPVVQFPVAEAGFTVGTLQPSNQGVLLG